MTTLKSQVNQVFQPTDEHELNRTFNTKKQTPVSQPTSARVKSPSRIPLPITPRKFTNDDKPIASTNDTSPSRSSLPTVPLGRSKTFHNNTSQPPPSLSSNTSDDANLLRIYKARLEQIFHKDSSTHSDIKIPNYTCMEDVLKSNEVFI